MQNVEYFLREYSVSHQNPTNKLIHKICVPAIMFSLLAMLWVAPFPWENSFYLNWSTLLTLFALGFYLSIKVGLGLFMSMVVQSTLMHIVCWQLVARAPLGKIALAIFVVSWILQFWGHKIEGKKPSFLQDLSFLLIGPLWVHQNLANKIQNEAKRA